METKVDYTEEEINALRGIFAIFDQDQSGFINVAELENILEKIGRTAEDAAEMLSHVDEVTGGRDDGKITFEEFLALMNSSQKQDETADGCDPKVLEFLRILEEYRMKCEEEGDYMEAGRANNQMNMLRKQEERRQGKSLRSRQISERQDVQIAHNMQYTEFKNAWDKYLEEYDQMAQMYIQQMTEKHAVQLLEFQKQLHKEVTERPPKFSKELLEWRRRQHMLARQKNYAEAQKIKRIADMMEERERQTMGDSNRQVFARKEAKFRGQQQAELQALLKRIGGRRNEHLKQRDLDSKRLLQRNRNVQAVLESKQAVEVQKKMQGVKLVLNPKNVLNQTRGASNSVSLTTGRHMGRRVDHSPEQS